MRFLLLLVLVLVGCGEVIYGGTADEGYGAAGTAPRVDLAFPGTDTQTLPQDGSITFSAEGSDDDSLQLEWQWELGGVLQAFGDSQDGSFDASWTLLWDPTLTGLFTDVRFAVYDEARGTEIFWPVTIE